ncbi:hypothetical protein [Bauldia sp.]|uniref:hypothetical protein n=1 Tax=Bauldia sp. TaxID=2575872 RepID=UPI003BACC44A
MPTQSTDLIVDLTPAIAFNKDGQTWRIDPEVLVRSEQNAAIVSTFADSKLINRGTVESGAAGAVAAIELSGADAKIVNKKSGEIEGEAGVWLQSGANNVEVINKGLIEGRQNAIVVVGDIEGLTIENHGTLFGSASAIQVAYLLEDASSGALIDNHGKIKGGIGINLNFNTDVDRDAIVVNQSGAKIKGVDGTAILAGAGRTRLDLVNEGKIDGDVETKGADDKIVNKGTIDGEVHFGWGHDVYKNKDGKAGKLYGDLGNDKFVLGNSKDKIVFDTAPETFFNEDTVKNFESGKDKFFLDAAIFGGLAPGPLPKSQFKKGPEATKPDHRIIYDKATGELSYDPTGSAVGGDADLFAILDPGTKLKASDFTVFA